jgi:hypothetical protein
MAEAGTVDNPLLPKNATDSQLQRFALLGPFVAGKNATVQQQKLHRFLDDLRFLAPPQHQTPFDCLRYIRGLEGDAGIRRLLEEHKVGQYGRLTKTLLHFLDADWDLRSCTRDQLVDTPGISFKTASFFLMFSRDADMACLDCLDVHLLRWMRNHPDFPDDIPLQTPPPRRYLELEKLFLDHCVRENRRPYELDFEIWSANRREVQYG